MRDEVKVHSLGLRRPHNYALVRAETTREGITLHTRRQTFRALMLRGGCDLHALQCMLGHSRLDTQRSTCIPG